jgi:hypothetical protein
MEKGSINVSGFTIKLMFAVTAAGNYCDVKQFKACIRNFCLLKTSCILIKIAIGVG